MKISYTLRWGPTGTAYRQTIRITAEENHRIFGGSFRPGINYGNAYTGAHVASKIAGMPEYKNQLKRLVAANSIVFVGDGTIPVTY